MAKAKNKFTEYLRHDYEDRKQKNPRFSLRSYAKSLDISPSHLSQILSNKRIVKAKSAMRISQNLGLTPSESFTLLQDESTSIALNVKKILSMQEFSLISEWYYYAILGIANLKINSNNASWIAKKLTLPIAVVQRAYNELLKFDHIVERGGHFRQASEPHRTTDDVASFKIKRYHKQNLHIASEKLDQIPPDFREYCTMTIPLSPKSIGAAKKMIRKFKEEFADELDRGKQTEVYNLCIQFFPLTNLDSIQKSPKKGQVSSSEPFVDAQ